MEYVEKLTNMLLVAGGLRCTNIVDDHVPHSYVSSRFFSHVLSKPAGNCFRKVFMFRDRKYLFLRQPAHRNAVFKRDHGATLF